MSIYCAAIAVTLGLPQLPEVWSNDQVLSFIRLMWHQWRIKCGRGNENASTDAMRGPAPPAAVAAAAKIAFTSLGTAPGEELRTEAHDLPVAERAPVDSSAAALLERSESGTVRVPSYSSSFGEVCDWTDSDSHSETRATVKATSSLVTGAIDPLVDLEKRNKNLHWLRVHFRSLNEVGRLPFNNADLWQLHQYYFSPPSSNVDTDISEGTSSGDGKGSEGGAPIAHSTTASAAPPGRHLKASSSLGRAISFQELGATLATSGSGPAIASHKRLPDSAADEGHASKRPRYLKTRIAYYPRIMVSASSLHRCTSCALFLKLLDS